MPSQILVGIVHFDRNALVTGAVVWYRDTEGVDVIAVMDGVALPRLHSIHNSRYVTVKYCDHHTV
ncbi:hypothetical protein D3C77_766640 [compost metagenome]